MNVRRPQEILNPPLRTLGKRNQKLMNESVDPWFNFRATKYLVQNGFYSFWDWFDDRKPPDDLEWRWIARRTGFVSRIINFLG